MAMNEILTGYKNRLIQKRYSMSSLQKIFKRALFKSGINKKVP